jgi:hypothetical protein
MDFLALIDAPLSSRIDEIPCIFPANREFRDRDEFARDCPLQRGVRCELDIRPPVPPPRGKQIGQIEQVFGLADLEQFTAPPPPKT